MDTFEKLDKVDLQILRTLQENARLTTKELAARVSLSSTPVFERLKRLESGGYIKKYIAVLDAEKLIVQKTARDGVTVAVAAEHLVAVPARHAVGLLNHAGRVLGQELVFGQRHQMPLDLGRRGRTGNQKQIRSADFQHFLQDFRQFHGHSSPAASNSRSSPSGSPSSVARRYTVRT